MIALCKLSTAFLKLNASLPKGRSAGLRPRSIDESKSATANPCVATSQS
ncbi:hypothetical protein [Leptospira kirschneri]